MITPNYRTLLEIENARLEQLDRDFQREWQEPYENKPPVRGLRVSASDCERASERICNQVSRALCILEFIARHKYGVTIEMIEEHIAENDGFNVGRRTILRDAAVLVRLGFVIDDRSEGFSRLKVDPLKLLPSLMKQSSDLQEGK